MKNKPRYIKWITQSDSRTSGLVNHWIDYSGNENNGIIIGNELHNIAEKCVKQYRKITLTKRIKNMFKSKNRKLIEELQEEINVLKVCKDSQYEFLRRVTDPIGEKLEELQLQSECGFTHEADCEIKESEYDYLVFGDYSYTPEYETCKTCGKKLAKFDTELEANIRKHELMQIEADKLADQNEQDIINESENKKEVKLCI